MDPPACMNGHIMTDHHGTGGIRVEGEWYCPECHGCDCYWCADAEWHDSHSREQNGKTFVY